MDKIVREHNSYFLIEGNILDCMWDHVLKDIALNGQSKGESNKSLIGVRARRY